MTTTDIGRLGERIAAKYLKKQGFRILATNKHFSHNELDLIAKNKEYILFVEVKTRSVEGDDLYLKYGSPASAVDRRKQLRLLRAARDYLATAKLKGQQPRMDVIEIYLNKETKKAIEIHHIPDAFGA